MATLWWSFCLAFFFPLRFSENPFAKIASEAKILELETSMAGAATVPFPLREGWMRGVRKWVGWCIYINKYDLKKNIYNLYNNIYIYTVVKVDGMALTPMYWFIMAP